MEDELKEYAAELSVLEAELHEHFENERRFLDEMTLEVTRQIAEY